MCCGYSRIPTASDCDVRLAFLSHPGELINSATVELYKKKKTRKKMIEPRQED